jgi:hypothetical protein
LEVQLNASQRERIPAGVRIHLIKSSRGSYIRTPDGKFFAIRHLPSTSQHGLKLSSMPPPPPSSNPIDQFLFGKFKKKQHNFLFLFEYNLDGSSMSSLPSTPSLMNDLNDEIDLLIDDTSSSNPPLHHPPPPPPSSAFEDLSSWHNDYFQQRNFFSDFFPTNSTLPMLSPSTNIDTDNSTNNFTSNALTFM